MENEKAKTPRRTAEAMIKVSEEKIARLQRLLATAEKEKKEREEKLKKRKTLTELRLLKAKKYQIGEHLISLFGEDKTAEEIINNVRVKFGYAAVALNPKSGRIIKEEKAADTAGEEQEESEALDTAASVIE